MASGWAYVGCSDTGSVKGGGPEGAVQFHTGSGGLSGSSYLSWSYGGPVRTLYVSGNLDVTGTIYADAVDVVNVTHQTISFVTSSGDSKFGDTPDDLHQFTGSIAVSSSLAVPALYVTASGRVGLSTITPSASLHISGGMAVNYRNITAAVVSASVEDYVLGCSASSLITINLPSPATAGRGRLLIIKDEFYLTSSRGAAFAITASDGDAGFLVEGSSNYYIYGSSGGAVTLYSDGDARWFVV